MGQSWALPTNMVIPAGFGFNPTNEQLINAYLKPKIMGTMDSHDVDFIIDTIDDISKLDPSELASMCSKPWDCKEYCYFFCKWNPYGKGNRCDRKTKTGFWKKTGKELNILDSVTKAVIGKRSILVFYRGHTRATKTHYKIHAYEITNQSSLRLQVSPYVICRLEKPAIESKKTEKRVENGGTSAVLSDASSLGVGLIEGKHGGEPIIDDTCDGGGMPLPYTESQLVDDEARSGIDSIAAENGLNEWNVGSLSESLGLPFDNGGEPSVSDTSNDGILVPNTTKTQPVDNEAMSRIQSLTRQPLYSPPHEHGEMQDLCESASSDTFFSDLLGIFYVPDDGSEKNTDNIFNGLDEPASTDRYTDDNGPVESCSLAP